ncbi:MAG: DUF2752 domain-containing protein [Verrucomicrobiota bacterium]|jgi:hypothetical protein
MRAQSQTVPPKISAPPSLGFFAAITLAFAGIVTGAVLFCFDPAKNNFYPTCTFHALTGLNCPGCGMTRAAYQLLHGHILRALQDNALFVLTLPALGARSVWFVTRKISKQPVIFFVPPKALWAFLVVALVFAVLRNLPAFSFLSP